MCEHALAAHELERGDWLAAAEGCASALDRPAPPAFRSLLHSLRSEALLHGGLTRPASEEAAEAVRLAELNREQALVSAADRASFHRVAYASAHGALARCRQAMGRPEACIDVLEDLLSAELPAELKEESRARIEVQLGTAHAERFLAGDEDTEEIAMQFYSLALKRERISGRDRFAALTRSAYLHLKAGRLAEADASLTDERLITADYGGAQAPLDPYDTAWMEALRARAARLSGRPTSEALDQACANLLQQWKRTQRPSGVGYLRFGRLRFALSEQVESRLATAGPEAAVEAVFAAQALGALHAALDPQPVGLEIARKELLGAGRGCLLFLAGKDRCHVFAFDDRQVVHERIASRHELEEVVGALQRSVATVAAPESDASQRRGLEKEAQATGVALLGDKVRSALSRWSHLIVIGREMVWNAPLELLPLGERRLGLALAICDLPSLSIGVALKRQHEARRDEDSTAVGRLEVLYRPEWSTHAHALEPDAEPIPPLSAHELPEIEGYEAQHYEGAHATASAFLGPPAVEVQVVIGHGLRDPGEESGGAFAVTTDAWVPDGVLSAENLRSLDDALIAPLVVLDTCHGRAGPARLGDSDAAHLGGAMLARGSEAVVLSRAESEVNLQPALAFTHALFRGLRGGMTLDEAAREARSELYAENELVGLARAAPWIVLGWGGWRLEHAPQRGAGFYPRVIGIPGAAAAVLIAWGWARRRRKKTTPRTA